MSVKFEAEVNPEFPNLYVSEDNELPMLLSSDRGEYAIQDYKMRTLSAL